MYFLTPQPRTFPPVLPNTIFHLGDIIVSFQQLVILGSTVVLMLLLWYIVQYTKMGKAMRAVSYDTDAALLMGINVDHVISFTFALGSALAGAAGVLVGIYYNTIDPLMGIMPGLKAFIAAVLGGIGIIPGAMMGGLILGVVEALVSGFISSTFRDAAAFGILIVILLIKPTGLLGKTKQRRCEPCRSSNPYGNTTWRSSLPPLSSSPCWKCSSTCVSSLPSGGFRSSSSASTSFWRRASTSSTASPASSLWAMQDSWR